MARPLGEIRGAIKAGPHRIIRFIPTDYVDNRFETMLDVQEFVASHDVSIRGWDFPYVTDREDEHGFEEDYFWSVVEFGEIIEYWRLYKSAQFYAEFADRARHADYQGAMTQRARGARFSVSVSDVIYTVSEYVEFAHRLAYA